MIDKTELTVSNLKKKYPNVLHFLTGIIIFEYPEISRMLSSYDFCFCLNTYQFYEIDIEDEEKLNEYKEELEDLKLKEYKLKNEKNNEYVKDLFKNENKIKTNEKKSYEKRNKILDSIFNEYNSKLEQLKNKEIILPSGRKKEWFIERLKEEMESQKYFFVNEILPLNEQNLKNFKENELNKIEINILNTKKNIENRIRKIKNYNESIIDINEILKGLKDG